MLLSTHIVEDVHQVCEELAVLRKGRLFYAGRASALMERIDGKVKIMRLESEEQLIQLQKQAIVISTTYESNGIVARIMDENMAFDRAERVQATRKTPMCHAWEGNLMSKCFSIICHECKMQLKRIAIWVVLFAASAIALTDNLPTVGNLARLEFLVQPTYFIYRTMSLDALIMIFGLMVPLVKQLSS